MLHLWKRSLKGSKKNPEVRRHFSCTFYLYIIIIISVIWQNNLKLKVSNSTVQIAIVIQGNSDRYNLKLEGRHLRPVYTLNKKERLG